MVELANATLPVFVPAVPTLRALAPWMARVPPIVALLVTFKPRPAALRLSWPAILLAAVPLTTRLPLSVILPAPTLSVPIVAVPVMAALLLTLSAVPAPVKLVLPLKVLAPTPVWV